ncbi:hypothetical protein DPMN_169828 [Dreissena polymorpha]|uniref:Uncharacterized protein n=1 Tax=Dreissena polymorpha TaxID=45954 RepID=A0A9D4DVA6_DREPO|nr:hypothetical protein DPMN_169828 [Dreissena polymorpha]
MSLCPCSIHWSTWLQNTSCRSWSMCVELGSSRMCGPCTVGLCTDALSVQTTTSKGGTDASTTRPTTAARRSIFWRSF